MRKAITWILISLSMALLIYLLSMWILCKIQYKNLPLFYLVMGEYAAPNGGHTYHASMDWNDAEHYDVVVLGASRAQRGYNTKLFDSLGIKMFNMGSPSQSIQNSSILLHHHITGSHVKEVWLDLVPALFRGNAFESTSDLIQNWSPTSTAVQIAWASKDLRALNLWMKRIFCENTFLQQGKGDYTMRGYVEVDAPLSNKCVEEYMKGNYGHETRGYVAISEQALKELEGMIQYCESNQIKMRFIASPVSAFNNHLDQKAMNAAIQPLIKRYKLQFLDYSERQEWKTLDDFYDEKHLNAKGVRKFNIDLWDKIQSNH